MHRHGHGHIRALAIEYTHALSLCRAGLRMHSANAHKLMHNVAIEMAKMALLAASAPFNECTVHTHTTNTYRKRWRDCGIRCPSSYWRQATVSNGNHINECMGSISAGQNRRRQLKLSPWLLARHGNLVTRRCNKIINSGYWYDRRARCNICLLFTIKTAGWNRFFDGYFCEIFEISR